MRLRERAVFDSFIAGPNTQAVETLRAGARGQLREAQWLTGPVGAGKSHLLQALCAESQQAQRTSAYLPLRELRSLGVEALAGWQQIQVLAVDDVDAVAGMREWEQALFGLYREAQEHGALLVATARDVPRALSFALPDLASRFNAANLLRLRPLEEEQQREALRVRALARGLELPEETALYLQRHFPRDLATLCQLLDTLDDAALAAQRRITVPFIRSVLESRA